MDVISVPVQASTLHRKAKLAHTGSVPKKTEMSFFGVSDPVLGKVRNSLPKEFIATRPTFCVQI